MLNVASRATTSSIIVRDVKSSVFAASCQEVGRSRAIGEEAEQLGPGELGAALNLAVRGRDAGVRMPEESEAPFQVGRGRSRALPNFKGRPVASPPPGVQLAAALL